jgi:hypothetical protein
VPSSGLLSTYSFPALFTHSVPVVPGSGFALVGTKLRYSGSIPPTTVNFPAIVTSPDGSDVGLNVKRDVPVTDNPS